MVKEEVRIDIYGENFNPKKIRSLIEIKFDKEINPGDIGRIGRYKGISIPYGSASILAPENIHNPILWILNYVREKIEVIRCNGGTDIKLSVAYYYKGQCNCELGLDEIILLNNLRIPFIFSVYEDKELIEKLSPE